MNMMWKASNTLKLTLKKDIRIVENITFLQSSLQSPTFSSEAGQISKHVGAGSGKLKLFLMYEQTPQEQEQSV